MKDKLVLFIDLDGTLKTDSDDTNKYAGCIKLQSGRKLYEFLPRPYLNEFLGYAKQFSKRVVLCTASGGGYARRVLNSMGIEQYFDNIIAAEDFAKGGHIRSDEIGLFIDNDREMIDLKSKKIIGCRWGIKPYVLTWVVDTYKGDKEDKTLMELIEEIEKLEEEYKGGMP